MSFAVTMNAGGGHLIALPGDATGLVGSGRDGQHATVTGRRDRWVFRLERPDAGTGSGVLRRALAADSLDTTVEQLIVHANRLADR